MKVLMLGWELPPLFAGGIGMVCYEMIKELSNKDIPITYVMPLGPSEGMNSDFAKVIIAKNHKLGKQIKTKIIEIPSMFHAYQSPEQYEEEHSKFILEKNKTNSGKIILYGNNLFEEVDIFAKRMYAIVNTLDFDVIHAHDWMTFPAAIGIAKKTGKPLVVHVHNTIFDRYLGNASQIERDIELNGLRCADKIVAISQFIKNRLVNQYGINPNKISIVHNAKNTFMKLAGNAGEVSIKNKKVVLFTGRVTIQKGPEYFLYAAKKVLEKRKDVVFIMAGSGDMLNRMINLAAQLGISQYFIFTGRYTQSQGKSLYQRADCYVMPSVSEPFGIVPLEAMAEGAPTIISKQSGCSEVLRHALLVDFWDTNEMANKILGVLSYSILKKQLTEKGREEVENLTWDKPMNKLIEVYKEAINSKK